MNGLIGGIAISIVLSALVALLARSKRIGYGAGFAIAALLSIIAIFLQIPFAEILAPALAAIIFMLLPSNLKSK